MIGLFLLLGILGLIATVALLHAALFYFAWNLAVVPVFHMPEVTLLQAWLFCVLIGLVRGAATRISKKG